MKNLILSVVLLMSFLCKAQTNKANFKYFDYRGNDEIFNKEFDPSKAYLNPVLAGFYPDPSICKKGDDYYLVNSSFSYFPGIPIWHSKDLVNWKQIGHVLDKPSQLKLDGLELSGGIYAPTIRYNKTNDTFYIICTVVGGINNFIVKSKDPQKGWSEPISLPTVKGIDPSLFFDDNGKAFIVNCANPIETKWTGHKAIWFTEFDINLDKVIGQNKIIVDGGIDTAKHPMWLEGPHIYKVQNKYYLIAAEGGTSENHSQVAFESDSVDGPYKPCAINPILTQRSLDKNRKDLVTSTGHVDLIETSNGDWYAVFLATRPYADNYYNTGRETFLLPVRWQNGVPIVLENGKQVPIVVNKEGLKTKVDGQTGNFYWKDDFGDPKLGLAWNMLRTPREKWYTIKNGKLQLNATNKSIYKKENPSFLGRRQQHATFEASTSFDFSPKTANEMAGLVYFQNEMNNLILVKTLREGKQVLLLQNRIKGIVSIIAQVELPKNLQRKPLNVRIKVNKDKAAFYYQSTKKTIQLIADEIDITHLSTKYARGFVGSYIGIYTTLAN